MTEIEKIKDRIFIIECADRISEQERSELIKLKQKLAELSVTIEHCSTELLPANNLIMSNTANAILFTKEKIDLLKKTICQNATDDEFALFVDHCKRTNLDPFARQIYSVPYGKKRITQVSIDGFRLIAQRSQKYAGQKPAEWCGKDGIWKNVWTANENPYAARVGVLRKDFDEPLYAIAKWDAYALDSYERVKEMWRKMPDHMLAKVAESLALRKAFPQELSGLYSIEEMEEIKIKDEFYDATNEQKKILVETIHKFGIEKHDKVAEDYKWFNDRVLGCKMNDLVENVSSLLHEFKTKNISKNISNLSNEVILCQA